MNVLFTHVDISYAGPELAAALRRAIPEVQQVAEEFSGRPDNRNLVVVLTCPCCSGDPSMDLEGAILVTPFHGIDPARYRGRIHEVDCYPPFRMPAEKGEASTLDEFLGAFRRTIEQALASKP